MAAPPASASSVRRMRGGKWVSSMRLTRKLGILVVVPMVATAAFASLVVMAIPAVDSARLRMVSRPRPRMFVAGLWGPLALCRSRPGVAAFWWSRWPPPASIGGWPWWTG